MRKLNLLLVMIILFAISCKKQSELSDIKKETEKQLPLSCGVEEASARISTEMRNLMRSRARVGTVQAPSLLLYLNFDGATVHHGMPSSSGGFFSLIIRGTRTCPEPYLTEAQKAEIVQLVKDDFSPFKIEVTTSREVYDNYNSGLRHVCIITTMPDVIGMGFGIGGVAAWYGPGVRSPNDPTFVFGSMYMDNNEFGNNYDIAAVISHEVGHNLGLDHQGKFTESDCSFLHEYHPGFGTGSLSFAPIMGRGYGKRISNWYAQPCETQNDFVFLNNQVALKEDDFPNNLGERTPAKTGTRGVLGIAGDVDFLYISPHSPKPVYITSDNIDIKVTMYNAGGQLISVHDDPNHLGITIPQAVGVCYLKIEAVSNVNMPSQFMTGEYQVSY